MICTHCNAALKVTASFCHLCGQAVAQWESEQVQQQKTVLFPQKEAEPSLTPWFCPRCGHYNLRVESICAECKEPCPYDKPKTASPPPLFQNMAQPIYQVVQPISPSVANTLIGQLPLKSRGVYIVLGLLFGGLGIHNFYAGRNGVGVAQLIIGLIGLCTFVPYVLTTIWAIVEVIAVDKDGYGRPML